MSPRHRVALLLLAALASAGAPAVAQDVERVGEWRWQEVMPEADSFAVAEGDPPVKRAYRAGGLIGYVFLTSDAPPEERGYSGPIDVLVGVTTDGVLTGALVTAYRESLRFERGDFMDVPWLVDQLRGKPVSDRFSVWNDVDGISGATISVVAMMRGLRDAARRVVLAHAPPPPRSLAMLSEAELTQLSWFEIQRLGLAAHMMVRQTRREPIDLSLVHLGSEAFGRYLLGRTYERLAREIEEAGGADEVVLYVVGGGEMVATLRSGWTIEQGGRTVALPRERVVAVGRPEGELVGLSSQVGALLLDDAEVDIRAPLTIAFDRDRPDLGTFRVDYTSRAALVRMAEAERAADAAREAERGVEPDGAGADAEPIEPLANAEPAGPSAPTVRAEPAAPAETATADAPEAPRPPASATPQASPQRRATEAAGGREGSSGAPGPWSRMGWTVLVIVLAGLAFATKRPALRWTSLVATTVVLGWVDGGFLSISHVTGLVWVGFTAFRTDPALLLLAGVTLGTLLLWGRVFCGFLCPFGALQDLIDRLTPRRFKRELPRAAHRVATKGKYVILALILGAALLGVEASLYQYFEPFGTVFFLSPNALLWAIAATVLAASVAIPRFYCRYVCPLGALLAVGSIVTLRRIRRVEQCNHCRVCEQRCPTGAITGPKVDFAECVRCNVCEVQLRERRGVCRHDMEDVRPRLVQLRVAKAD